MDFEYHGKKILVIISYSTALSITILLRLPRASQIDPVIPGDRFFTVASHKVPSPHIFEHRLDVPAHRGGIGATGMKPASRGWIYGAWDVSAQDDPFSLQVGIGYRYGRKE
ncbi:MAG: hypothetical protein AMS17_09980, partial [Spirochaetes bacterium DG_61]